ncbi:outer membrane protein assembly factor BamD [Cycloclasticus pugetii]|uniref:outer membrane protein assembly factor BamD n=1 Tax=Cycloclasticus pugetii TaxID=34068 RepID=UPI00091E6CBE|nr:outer membrane protein assembly factor BamD [Cycloclasticus pugetii]SHJ59895.1 Beta-barrel assembly machine subunit BamD [Cycloclasticus pugetii]|tara:strand:- start:349 stop:1194 length:846 start_codon:yes stop_codon:yes gene_type:complete
MNRPSIKKAFLILILASLAACSTMDLVTPIDTPDKTANWSAADFYDEAKKSLDDENYINAIELYEGLESRYPFGQYAQQAQIDLAFAYYKNDEPESAIATANRFIRIHPRHKNVDYLYYLKGLINFNRGIGFLERYLPTDKSQRDPGAAIESLDDFATLIRRFPNSQYVADSKQRIIALKSNLALHELNVANYYMKRKAYVAAINRAKNIIEQYQNTTAVPRALLLMVDAYQHINMNDLAADAQRVYDLNYPNGTPPLENPKYAHEKTTSEKIWEFLELDK